LHYLEAKPVQNDMGLTKDQRTKLTNLVARWQKETPSLARGAERQKLTEALEKEARGLLQPAQGQRLNQIILQLSVPEGRETDLFTLPQVVETLNLTREQQKKLSSIEEHRRKGLLALFVSTEEASEIAAKVKVFKKETYTQLRAALNERQQILFKELVGEAFLGEVKQPRGLLTATLAAPREPYVFILGLNLATSEELHKELKLDAQQIRKLLETRTTTLGTDARRGLGLGFSRGGDSQKKRRELAQATEKELATFLKPEQFARFKQLALQYSISSGVLGKKAHDFAEVQEELKLTEAQRKELNLGSKPAEVLTTTQHKKWKEKLGKPFPGNFHQAAPGFPVGGFWFPPPAGLEALHVKPVQVELQLRADQLKKVAELEKGWTERFKDGPVGLRDLKTLTTARTEVEQAIAKFLDAEQNRRLREILLQDTQKRGLDVLLTNPIVVAELKLGEEKQKRIREVLGDARALRILIDREFGDSPYDKGYRETLQEMEKITTKKLEETLGPAEKQVLEKLLGPPFKGEARRIPQGARGSFIGIR